MDTMTWIAVVGVSALLCVGAWAATRWWYRRQLAATAQRFDKVERAREFAIQQTLQARKQIEKLQKENAELRRLTSQAEAERVKARRLEATLRADAQVAAGPVERSALPTHGFADTLPM